MPRSASKRRGGITLGEANADGGVAEIVAYNADTGKAYVVNGQDSLLNVFDVNADGRASGAKTELNISALMAEEDASFTYGDMTSVAVDTTNDRIAVALQDADYTKAGRVAVLNYDNEVIAVYTDGRAARHAHLRGGRALYPDRGRGRAAQWLRHGHDGPRRLGHRHRHAGAGERGEGRRVRGPSIPQRSRRRGVIFNRIDGNILSAAADLEPEYIAVSGSTAYVALQEANAIAVLDIAAGSFTGVYPLGFKDYSKTENAVDLDDSDGDVSAQNV